MDGKTKRLIAIKRIIRDNSIHNQDELLLKLREEGFICTQATLSRDLKFLKVGKIPGESNKSIYKLPESVSQNAEERGQFIGGGIISVNFSLNIAVIKTEIAYPSIIAAAIDKANLYEVLGTVAGDDTIVIVLREGTSRNDFLKTLSLIVPSTKK